MNLALKGNGSAVRPSNAAGEINAQPLGRTIE